MLAQQLKECGVKIVIDTNILVSGIFWHGTPNLILENWIEKQAFSVIASPQILSEYIRVISEFTRKNEFLTKSWIDFLPSALSLIEPTFKTDVCRDPNDNMFLNVAVSADVDFIVSGDKDLLSIKSFHNILILDAKCFISKISHAKVK